MAGITTWNGATAPAGTEAWGYAAQVKRALETAGLVIPVANQTARDGLAALAPGGVLPVPTLVFRIDLGTYETWDGSVWRGQQHAEFTTSPNQAPQNTAWGMGNFSPDASLTNDSAFCTVNGVDKLQVRDAGTYAVTVLVGFISTVATPTATISGVSWLSADGNYTVGMLGGLQNFKDTLPNWKLPAGGIIKPLLSHGSGGDRTFQSRVRVTKIG